MAYGELGLKPDEFWGLYPGQFIIMLEGFHNRLKRERHDLVQLLHVMRYPAAVALATSSESGKATLQEVMWLPEIDGDYEEYLQKKEQMEREKQEKDDAIYRKYKALEGV